MMGVGMHGVYGLTERTLKGRSPFCGAGPSGGRLKKTTNPDLNIEGEKDQDKGIEPITSDMRRDERNCDRGYRG